MKDADVIRVIASAASRGIRVSDSQATTFLGAKELLEREPNNANALITVRNYSALLTTGNKPVSFAEWQLPEFYTDEELAAQNASRDAYVAATRGAQP